MIDRDGQPDFSPVPGFVFCFEKQTGLTRRRKRHQFNVPQLQALYNRKAKSAMECPANGFQV
jgi:hypothetical protein